MWVSPIEYVKILQSQIVNPGFHTLFIFFFNWLAHQIPSIKGDQGDMLVTASLAFFLFLFFAA